MLHMLAEGEPAATYAHSNTQIELRTVAVSSWEWKALLASDRAVDRALHLHPPPSHKSTLYPAFNRAVWSCVTFTPL